MRVRLAVDVDDLDRYLIARHFRTADGDTLAGACEGGELMDEDLYNLPRIQRGMNSAAFEALHLCTQEVRILHHHDTLMRYLQARQGGARSEPQASGAERRG